MDRFFEIVSLYAGDHVLGTTGALATSEIERRCAEMLLENLLGMVPEATPSPCYVENFAQSLNF